MLGAYPREVKRGMSVCNHFPQNPTKGGVLQSGDMYMMLANKLKNSRPCLITLLFLKLDGIS